MAIDEEKFSQEAYTFVLQEVKRVKKIFHSLIEKFHQQTKGRKISLFFLFVSLLLTPVVIATPAILGSHAASGLFGTCIQAPDCVKNNTCPALSQAKGIHWCGVFGDSITPSTSPTPILSPSGWNYNLTHRCVQSIPSTISNSNYYSDTTDCPIPNKNWTIAVQAENLNEGQYTGNSCIGSNDVSLPINANGPLTMSWIPHTDEFGNKNWTVDLKQNFVNFTNPCGAGTFTWYDFIDNTTSNGGPLQNPMQLSFSAKVHYNSYEPGGRTRAFAGFGGEWNNASHQIEINVYSSYYIPSSHTFTDPVIQTYINTPTLQYISVDGSKLGLNVIKNQDTTVNVNWSSIIQRFVSEGYFSKPISSWLNVQNESVNVGIEGYTGKVATNSYVSDLYFTNFRPSSTNCDPDTTCQISPTPIPTPFPSTATASSSLSTSSPSFAVDGNTATLWNSGQFPGTNGQWIELNLGAPQTISKLLLTVAQSPAGNTTHTIYAGSAPNPTTQVAQFIGNTTDGQVLEKDFTTPLTNIQYIRAVTTQSPSYVAWREIQAFGQ